MEHVAYSNTTLNDTITKLTRTESGKLVSVLTRVFGAHNIELAEDVIQDVLLKALEKWQKDGIPDNPTGWLYKASKNRAIDIIRKNRREVQYATDITPLLQSEYTASTILEECFTDIEIQDDQLRMMFACCHPDIAREGQIAMVLKTISGFTIAQIAKAFITNSDTIEKRLYRARKSFRDGKVTFEIPIGKELQERLDNVLETIYLLFNEAYSSSYHEELIREELAIDAIRLCHTLANHPITQYPKTYALLALCHFHTARMPSRLDADGNLLLMDEQNRNLWNRDFIDLGIHYLTKASSGEEISKYHIEAAIAFEHCKAKSYKETDWNIILEYYNILQRISNSPVTLLNRAIVLKELQDAQIAIDAIKAIPGIDHLNNYYLLHAILGKLNMEVKNIQKARFHLEKALKLVVSDAEKRLIIKSLNELSDE